MTMNLNQRCSGVLAHITSLPGPHGAGDFGPGAYRFVDWLQSAGQTLWQLLPITPIGPAPAVPAPPASTVPSPAVALPPLLGRLPLRTTLACWRAARKS